MRRYSLPLAVFAAFACGPHHVTYDAKHDDGAMLAITRAWQGGGVTLSLCEDVATEASQPANSCQVSHVVLGGTRTVTSTQNVSGGCGGGCGFNNVAYVTGQVSETGRDLELQGSVMLASAYDDDPYAYPYTLELHCADGSCTATGTLESDGTLHLAIDGGANVDLAPVAASACP